MAKLLLAHEDTGKTLYFNVLDSDAKRWNGSAFEVYDAGRWGYYDIAMTEQGSSGIYYGTFPAAAAGNYSVVYFDQNGASPAEGDDRIGSCDVYWNGTGFVDVAGIIAHGDSEWATVSAATIGGAVLETPANLLVTDALGQVTAENMRGTDDAYTGTPPTASEITTAVWAAGTRTLTSFGTLVADVATAVWGAVTRTLTGFAHTVTATGVSDVKAVTDKLGTALVLDGSVYQFTANALELGPVGGDATEAKQDTIIAAIGALNDLDAAAVSTAVEDAVIDGALTLQDVLKRVHAKGVGKAVRTGTDPTEVAYYDSADVLLFTLTIANDNTGRTVA